MTTRRISFLWEDDGRMSYETLFDYLMSIGADAIEEEEVEPEPKVERSNKKKKKS